MRTSNLILTEEESLSGMIDFFEFCRRVFAFMFVIKNRLFLDTK